MPEEKVDKKGEKYIIFNGSSPDELALVNGARHLGFKFRCKDEDNNMVIDSWEEELKYELLNISPRSKTYDLLQSLYSSFRIQFHQRFENKLE